MLTVIEVPPSGNVSTQLIILVVLIIINAFFAASELAILSANPLKIKMLSESGNKKALLVQKLQENETSFLSTIQVGITLAGFFSSATAAVSLSDGLSKFFLDLNISFANELALIIVTLILSYFTLVFGELFPKRIALRSPEKIAMLFSKPINVIRILFKPIVFLLSSSCEILVKIFRLKAKDEEQVTEDEVKALVSTAVNNGTIDNNDQDLINAVFTFTDLTVKDVMTPRIDITMININNDISKTIQIIKDEKYTRIPFYEDNKDNIVGVLNIKDILLSLNYSNISNNDLKSILRKPTYVIETMKVDDLFKQLQKNKQKYALVVDEQGSISGMITIEDIVEEIMGNIYDEHDDDVNLITKINENKYIVNSSISIQDLNKELGLTIPKDTKYHSLAGFIINELKTIPKVNDIVLINQNNIEMKVIEVNKNRVLNVEITFYQST